MEDLSQVKPNWMRHAPNQTTTGSIKIKIVDDYDYDVLDKSSFQIGFDRDWNPTKSRQNHQLMSTMIKRKILSNLDLPILTKN